MLAEVRRLAGYPAGLIQPRPRRTTIAAEASPYGRFSSRLRFCCLHKRMTDRRLPVQDRFPPRLRSRSKPAPLLPYQSGGSRCLADVGRQVPVGRHELVPPRRAVAAFPAGEVGGEVFDMDLVPGSVLGEQVHGHAGRCGSRPSSTAPATWPATPGCPTSPNCRTRPAPSTGAYWKPNVPARAPSLRAQPSSGSRTRPAARTGGGPRLSDSAILGSRPWPAPCAPPCWPQPASPTRACAP
jgi:hypothetical protein